MLLELCCSSLLLAAPGGSGSVAGAGRSAARPEASVFVVRADKLLLGDGTTLEQGAVLVEDGRIRAFGKDVDAPEGAGVLKHSGWMSAGLVALHAYAGAPEEMRDSTRPVLD